MDKIEKYVKNIKATIFLLINTSKVLFACIVILNSISGVIITTKLYIWKEVIDAVTQVLQGSGEKKYDSIIFYLCLHFFVSAIDYIISSVVSYIQNLYGEYLDKNITEMVIKKISKLGLKDFEKTGNYNIIQKVNDFSLNRSISILNTIIQLIKAVASIAGTVVLLWKVNKILIIIVMLSNIPLLVVNNKIYDKWYDVLDKRYEKLRLIQALKGLCIKYENIKELKVFNVINYIGERISEIYSKNIYEDTITRKKFMYQTIFLYTMDLVVLYIIKLYCIIKSVVQRYSLGSLLTYVQTIDVLKNALNNMMEMISKTYEDSLYIANLFEFLEIEESEEGTLDFGNKINKIEFTNVSFRYPNTKTDALKNFSFLFEAGKTYGIIGLNGSGKTTLIKLILGLYNIENGVIRVNEKEMNQIQKRQYWELVSVIFQDFIKYPFSFIDNMTIADHNVDFHKDDIDNVVNIVGLSHLVENLPEGYYTNLGKEWKDSVELSLGQWQKLALTRALLKKSNMIILDEPTASLDAVTENTIFNHLFKSNNKKITIIVSHRLKNVKGADKIVVLKNGEICEVGSYKELMEKKGEYYKLYVLQEKEVAKNNDTI